MKKNFLAVCLTILTMSLCGCDGSNPLDQYDLDGIAYMAYTDIDSVCDHVQLAEEGRKLLASVEDHILLSFVVDSSVQITEELGDYDHLVMTNLPWIERFGDPDKLKSIEYDSISNNMRDFLDEQMALLMADGHGWFESDNVHLYQYENGKLFAFPTNVTLGAAKPLETKNPLIILVDKPAETLRPDSCMLPLASSGNVLFEGVSEIQTALEASALKEYCTIQTLELGQK